MVAEKFASIYRDLRDVLLVCVGWKRFRCRKINCLASAVLRFGRVPMIHVGWQDFVCSVQILLSLFNIVR